MSPRATKNRRGAATLEMALGILVLVPVLLYGMHFAELGVVSMKVTEAGAAPLWDATAYPMHITGLPTSYAPGAYMANAITNSNISAYFRYGVNFDGRMSALGTDRSGRYRGLVQYTQAMTVAAGMDVRCASSRASPGPRLDYEPTFTRTMLRDNGGMACRAEAAAFNLLPDAFVEGSGGGLFEASMKESWAMRRGVGLCSLGRPNGLFGPCQGAFAMMYDDWGLASGEFPTGGNEADICPVTLAGLPCQNVPYYTAAMAFYQQATTLIDLVLGSAHRRLVAVTVGATPPLMASDTEFYMSFTGETAGFTMLTPSSDVDFMVWQTTPFIWPTTYGVGYGFRRACYLGYSGC